MQGNTLSNGMKCYDMSMLQNQVESAMKSLKHSEKNMQRIQGQANNDTTSIQVNIVKENQEENKVNILA
ncbi:MULTISPECIES: hypothetical protein [unclassified Campylobacter]|uniref:hypothetical protein n=1 Tax=unclassified Campylobacter TaxID=2593542 RepID=UPI001237BC5B|nr:MULTISPECIES: hypothetical protein [unclassified Campylobacter]KAA6224569.1 hypothetical protein FMM54_08250 [Campylobacter sp. LR185c]KAA6224916.1 hypothetical protein FMM55_08440 [Campylobacter sp. LR196d]KAA6225413.1 hypothetical protein FMM57_07705 [Campylobacter sp. LR286c]KAA6229117.1 hypothetical protein FMM58_08470 [Campylobacter sp. LR291e]KAA6229601.1 hypothetical protein FMM56_07730 [Campylobacter sp. LR264d]